MSFFNIFKHKKAAATSQLADPAARSLYNQLQRGLENNSDGYWNVTDLDEGMAVVNEVFMGYWKPRYLMDHRNKSAVEFMDGGEKLCTVSVDDIDWDKMGSVKNIERAKQLDFHYPSFIRVFKNNLAVVEWQLNPDGRYFMDEDGYGMTDDQEENIFGIIDRSGKVVVKFQPLPEGVYSDSLRKEAEKIHKS